MKGRSVYRLVMVTRLTDAILECRWKEADGVSHDADQRWEVFVDGDWQVTKDGIFQRRISVIYVMRVTTERNGDCSLALQICTRSLLQAESFSNLLGSQFDPFWNIKVTSLLSSYKLSQTPVIYLVTGVPGCDVNLLILLPSHTDPPPSSPVQVKVAQAGVGLSSKNLHKKKIII